MSFYLNVNFGYIFLEPERIPSCADRCPLIRRASDELIGGMLVKLIQRIMYPDVGGYR